MCQLVWTAHSLLHDQLHGVVSPLWNLSALQLMGWSSDQACSAIADLVVWHIMRETSLGLSDVDIYTCAWYFVHNICLFINGERVFEYIIEQKVGKGLKTILML